MEKEEIVKRLKEKGYTIELEDRLPTLRTVELTKTQVKALFREMGYEGSFRCKFLSQTAAANKTKEIEEIDEEINQEEE